MSIATIDLTIGGNIYIAGNDILAGSSINCPSAILPTTGLISSNGIIISSGQFLVQSSISSNSINSGALVVSGGISITGNCYIGGNMNFTGSLISQNFSAVNQFQITPSGNPPYLSSLFFTGTGHKLITTGVPLYVNNSGPILCLYTVIIQSAGNIILDTYSRTGYVSSIQDHYQSFFSYVTGNSISAQNIMISVSFSVISGNGSAISSQDPVSMTVLSLPF